MKRSGRLIALFLLVLLLAGVVVLILYRLGGESGVSRSIEQIQSAEGIPVEVARPIRRDFRDCLLCDGSVVADTRAVLRAKVEEVVEAVHVRAGEPVEKGQLLVEFRKTDLEAQIEAARAAYEEARSRYERNRNLFEQSVVSEDRLEQMRTAMENAAAALQTARSRRTFAEVMSPIDGYVEHRLVEPGEFKGVGKELLTLVDLSTLEVRALVPEADVAEIELGQKGEFQLESGDEWFQGTVSRIAPSTDDPNRFFHVYMKTENRREGERWLMRPGMYAEVRFVRRLVTDALALPAHSVVYEGNAEVAYLVEEGRVEVPVDAGALRTDLSFRERLVRGARRLNAWVRGQEQSQKAETEEVDALVARRVPVEVLDHEEGYVRIQASRLEDGARVVVNPREAIRDGTRVNIVGGEGS